MTQPEITQRDFAFEVVRRLHEAGFQALWAGGCVRDLLLKRTPKDYDVATNALPDQVRELFGKRRTLAIGASFGVIVVLGPKSAGQVEVATFRADGEYLDGRRPQSVTFSSAEEDAQRRDFTINGMFYDPLQEEVLDYVGGRDDLEKRQLRAIGDAEARMLEDKLRMLRAVRFTATLDFQLEQTTAKVIRSLAEQVTVVSAERITQELKRMLVHENRRSALELTHDLHLLAVIFPELQSLIDSNPLAWTRTLQALASLKTTSFPLAMAVLLHGIPDAAEAICDRLKLSNQETKEILWLIEHRDALKGAPAFSMAKLKRLLAEEYVPPLLTMVLANLQAKGESLTDLQFVENYLGVTPEEVISPPPLLSGDTLIAHGFQPGRHFKTMLDAIRDAQLNCEISTETEALTLAAQLQERETDDKKEAQ